VPVFAQSPTEATVDQTVARKYLTDARNALSDLTGLPAAAQLAGDSRVRVQRLITQFNELITQTSDWRASCGTVEVTLASLLAPEPAAPASGTPGAVGTSGRDNTLDPTIRAKLVEFGTHLERFKVAATAPPPTSAAAEPPASATTIDDNPAVDPPPTDDQGSSDVARDILLHVEAIEVILGAQAAAQKAATVAAGGVVTTSETPSGSTRTTITNPNVTLDAKQLEQVKTHLAGIRRLVESKR
jgi:hypothetical protein